MTVVVTGASGFIGGAVLKVLAERKIGAIAVSRRPVNASVQSVQVTNYRETPHGDALIHLAESSHQSTIEQIGPEYAREVTTLVEHLIAKEYRRFIYASSAVVYNADRPGGQHTHDAVVPSHIYARSKYENEQRVLGAGGVAARISNVYGQGMSKDNVVSRILDQLHDAGPIHIIDDNPVRDFIWVDDVAEALVDMALGSATGPFNIGSGIGTSIRDLAHVATRLAGPAPRALAPSHPTRDVNVRVLDISTTAAAFGWRPAVTLEQGLGRLIEV
jgi:UDP-glucose 4-epimerase